MGDDPATGAPVASRWARLRWLPTVLVVGAIVVIVAGGALLLGSARLASGPVDAASLVASEIPPAGEVWFGTDFDHTSFAMTGRSDHARTGATVAIVAHLSRAIGSGQASVVVELGSTTMADHALNLSGSGTGDVVGWTFALPVAGDYRVTVTGPDGSVLAAGQVTAQ